MKIRELHLLSNDLIETKRFYNEVLELPVVYHDKAVIKFSCGSSLLVFQKAADSNPVYHFALNIPADQFNEALKWLMSKLQPIAITPSNYIADFKSWNAKAVYFFDNNKNIVELIARFDLHEPSHQIFSGASFCAISEIGLVVDDPASYAASVIAEYGIGYFSKQPPLHDFIAAGDDHGLFIIVNKNRDWYPTKIKSASFYTKAILEQNSIEYQLVLNGQ